MIDGVFFFSTDAGGKLRKQALDSLMQLRVNDLARPAVDRDVRRDPVVLDLRALVIVACAALHRDAELAAVHKAPRVNRGNPAPGPAPNHRPEPGLLERVGLMINEGTARWQPGLA